jgi:dihydrofolate reductase
VGSPRSRPREEEEEESMRRVFSFIVTTLDGYFVGPNQEFDWPNVDEEFDRFAVRQLEEVDTLLFGRATYELMASYWPTQAAQEEEPIIAEKMNGLPKIVFSTTLGSVEWDNSTLVRGDATEEVTKLKQRPGKDMVIFGSSNLTSGLLQAGVLDELRIMVNPVALGDGRSLLEGMKERVKLRLLSATTFSSGNVLLNYAPLGPTVQ